MLLDVQCDSLYDLLTLVLNEHELRYGMTSAQRSEVYHLFEDRPLFIESGSKEGCKVYVTCLPCLSSSLFAVVRMRQPVVVNENDVSIRYFLFVLGSGEQNSVDEYLLTPHITYRLREMGHAFSIMFSQTWFGKAARKVNTPRLLLKVISIGGFECS